MTQRLRCFPPDDRCFHSLMGRMFPSFLPPPARISRHPIRMLFLLELQVVPLLSSFCPLLPLTRPPLPPEASWLVSSSESAYYDPPTAKRQRTRRDEQPSVPAAPAVPPVSAFSIAASTQQHTAPSGALPFPLPPYLSLAVRIIVHGPSITEPRPPSPAALIAACLAGGSAPFTTRSRCVFTVPVIVTAEKRTPAPPARWRARIGNNQCRTLLVFVRGSTRYAC